MGAATITLPMSLVTWGLGVVTLLIGSAFGYIIYHVRKLEETKVDIELCKSNRENIGTTFSSHTLKIDNIDKKVETWKVQNARDHQELKTQFAKDHAKVEKQLENINTALSDIHDCVIKLSLNSKC